MKNKEITIYELMGLIKDGKTPKEIKYNNIICEFKNGHYFKKRSNERIGFSFDSLNNTLEILPEENEWEDIEEISTSMPTKEKNEEGVRYFINGLIVKINQLIKNQKYLKEKLENKDE